MKILVALDFSPASEAVISFVASRPWPSGTAMEVLHVADTDQSPSDSEDVADLQVRAEKLISDAAARLREAGIAADPVVVTGDPREAITARASEKLADWIVIAPHGNAGALDFLL